MLYPTFHELVSLRQKAAPLVLSSTQPVHSSSLGGYASPFRGQGLEFEEVRAYAPGDDIRSIDWRVTARLGSPHTKIFREDKERSVILCIDVNASMRFGTRGTFKSVQAAKIAALLGWQATLSHDKLGACLFGDVPQGLHFLAPQRSRKSLWALFKQLCRQDARDTALPVSLEDMLSHLLSVIPTGSLIYIISDFSRVSGDAEKHLRALRKRCDVVMIAVDDPADQMLPPLGPLVCVAPQGQLYVNTDNAKGRETYADEWQKTRKNLQTMLTKLKIRLISISTDAEASSDLFFALKHLARRALAR